MKKPAYILIALLFLAGSTAFAQSPVKFRHKSNPAYSVHNYKQPDKAAVAKQLNLDGTQTFAYVDATPEASQAAHYYKAQAVQSPAPVSGAVVPTDKKARKGINSPANYKRQF
jgi:hypothetical protein